MRRSFTCSAPGCGRVLAVVDPRTVLRIAAGVAVRHHVIYRRLAISCPCGWVTRIDVPRRVEEIVVEAEIAAA